MGSSVTAARRFWRSTADPHPNLIVLPVEPVSRGQLLLVTHAVAREHGACCRTKRDAVQSVWRKRQATNDALFW
jgi:hypothetical protein